jgi:methanogenic corrinoid protein MtbC1
MASMIRYEGHTSLDDGYIVERDFAPDLTGPASFPVQIDEDYARSLSALIESEIIPRLMVAHATVSQATGSVKSDAVIAFDEVEAFAPLVMQVEADALLAHVESIIARGVSFDTVLVDLLAPTARLLGEFWEDERCDFVDVTMGLWRLQEVVHEISGRMPAERPLAAGARRALFAPLPGDQHSFGTVVIDDLFRRDGWLTDRLSEAETHDLLRRVEDDWFDIIGLTVSCDCHIATLPSMIAALRNVSRNPQICVMVGGRVFSANPDLVAHVGADGTARDAKFAPKIAGELVRERERGAASCS